jgi:hypothetical protein
VARCRPSKLQRVERAGKPAVSFRLEEAHTRRKAVRGSRPDEVDPVVLGQMVEDVPGYALDAAPARCLGEDNCGVGSQDASGPPRRGAANCRARAAADVDANAIPATTHARVVVPPVQ